MKRSKNKTQETPGFLITRLMHTLDKEMGWVAVDRSAEKQTMRKPFNLVR
jgi:hypothetical protein